MTLPGTIVRRPNDFSQPDYSVVYKDPDGRELIVGRIFKNHGLAGGTRPWFWGVEFHQAQGRAKPWDGQVETLEEAEAAWRKCWDSADLPIRWPPALRRPSTASK